MVWERVKIRELVTSIDRKEIILPTKKYSMLGMRSKIKGPFLRETKNGNEISAKSLNKVFENDFIYSRLFAWQGSFGIIPRELNGSFVSNEFPIFKVNENLVDIRFLKYWFGLSSTQQLVERDCYGSTPGTRNRFKEEFFYELEIPLPSLNEQCKIADRLDDVQAMLIARESQLASIEHETEAMLFNAFSEIIDGVEYRPLLTVAPLNRRPVEIEPDIEYPVIAARSFGRGLFHKPSILGASVTWQKLFWVHEGDLLFSNIKAWEGAFGVASKKDHLRVGSHRYLTCTPVENLVTPNFLCYYLQTEDGLDNLGVASPGTADRNRTLGQKALMAIQVPIPSIEAQRRFDELYTHVESIRVIRASTAKDANALIPAMLHDIFERQAVESKTISVKASADVISLGTARNDKKSERFRETVLVGAIVKAFHSDDEQPIGNFRLQKAVYFARRHLGERALEKNYLRKAAGPYNPSMRYSGGIKVATDKDWIKRASGKFGEGNALGNAASEMDEWIEKYQFANAAAWVRDKFKYKQNDLWEVLATVDYAVLALEAQGLNANASGVLDYIKKDKEWSPKIERLNLTEPAIQNALVELQTLFG